MAKKRRELKLHGALSVLSELPPSLRRTKPFLDALPIDEAYGLLALAKEVKVSHDHLQSSIKRLGEDYRYPEGNTFGYANPKTVKLKKEGYYGRQAES